MNISGTNRFIGCRTTKLCALKAHQTKMSLVEDSASLFSDNHPKVMGLQCNMSTWQFYIVIQRDNFFLKKKGIFLPRIDRRYFQISIRWWRLICFRENWNEIKCRWDHRGLWIWQQTRLPCRWTDWLFSYNRSTLALCRYVLFKFDKTLCLFEKVMSPQANNWYSVINPIMRIISDKIYLQFLLEDCMYTMMELPVERCFLIYNKNTANCNRNIN